MGLYPGYDQWDDNIHYVEIGDPGQGGFNGVSNIARIQLANRTEYLRQRSVEHTGNLSNPHSVTKSQIGLSNVMNATQLQLLQNLGDLTDKDAARLNLDVYQRSTIDSAVAALMRKDSNLSDLADKPTARTNLDVYSKGETTTITNQKLVKASNLSDLANKTTSRTNLDVYSKGEVTTYLNGKANKTHYHPEIFSWVKTADPTDTKNYGYLKLGPQSGYDLIIQWGVVLAYWGARTWNYPMTFPHAVYSIVGSEGVGGDSDTTTLFKISTKSQFITSSEQYITREASFIAIGC